uniref:CDT1 domain-containing protein n=1 Tax=Strongyloides venezuelensis TaxID=75913 RepID=A0A0K0EV60_STRVS
MKKECISTVEENIHASAENLVLHISGNPRNIRGKHSNNANVKNHLKDDENIMPPCENIFKYSVKKNNLNMMSSNNKMSNFFHENESSGRNKALLESDKCSEKRNKIKVKRLVIGKSKKKKIGVILKLVMDVNVKSPSHDKRKGFRVRYMNKGNVFEFKLPGDNTIRTCCKKHTKINENIHYDKECSKRNCFPKVERNLDNLNEMSSNLFTSLKSQSGQKVADNNITMKENTEFSSRTDTEMNFSEGVKGEPNNVTNSNNKSIDSVKKAKSIDDLFDETLELLCNPNSDNIPKYTFKTYVAEFCKQDIAILDDNVLTDIKKQNEFNKDMLNTIFGKEEEFEQQEYINDTIVSFPKLKNTRSIASDKICDLRCDKEIDKLRVVFNKRHHNEPTLSMEVIYQCNNISSFKRYEDEKEMILSLIAGVKESKRIKSNVPPAVYDRDGFKIPQLHKTVVNISKDQMSFSSKKGYYQPISPLVTDNQPLKMITFDDLYGKTGFEKFYSCKEVTLDQNQNNNHLSSNKKKYDNAILQERVDNMEYSSCDDDSSQEKMEVSDYNMEVLNNSNEEYDNFPKEKMEVEKNQVVRRCKQDNIYHIFNQHSKPKNINQSPI